MNYTQYKADFHRKLQSRMWNYTIALDVLVLVLDIIVSIYYYFNQSLVSPFTFRTYLTLEILIPVVLQILLLIINRILLMAGHFSMVVKNRICVYTLLTQFMFISFFHIRYEVVIFLPCMVMLLASMLADKDLLKALFFATGVIETATLVMFIVTNTQHFYTQKIIISIIVVCVQYMIFLVSRSLMNFQKGQLHHIYDNYAKMRELTVELKQEPLTRLYNRTAYAGAIERYIKLAEKNVADIYQVVLDLDNFKFVNDNYGHAAGDVVLITLAEIITKTLGSNRSAFRYGGDEFVLLFKEKPIDEVVRLVEIIRKEFENTVYDFLDENFKCTLSIGIAKYKPEMNSKTWFQAADEAAYQAKKSGKNQYVVAE